MATRVDFVHIEYAEVVREFKDMAIRAVSIALSTEDIQRSVKFYVEQLGFTCTLQLESFARVRLGAADILLAHPNTHLPWQGPKFTGSIYLDVDNVDELWESLKTRAPIAYPIETMEYGVREFGLLDDNGYQLSFAQHVAAG
ncbi:VOC family protein [Labrys neptuniae]|uniref:VOC family protein n=1 Tax=Labrys neptuniae TaxID=376174 RepID=A0ABV3PHY0_9HYPH|nr:VOC family protein [Labrys neptuniae]MDT3380608.1 VOC family protein [Labrys neptuniae]